MGSRPETGLAHALRAINLNLLAAGFFLRRPLAASRASSDSFPFRSRSRSRPRPVPVPAPPAQQADGGGGGGVSAASPSRLAGPRAAQMAAGHLAPLSAECDGSILPRHAGQARPTRRSPTGTATGHRPPATGSSVATKKRPHRRARPTNKTREFASVQLSCA